MMRARVLILAIFIYCVTLGDCIEKDKWIDPLDMVSYNTDTKTNTADKHQTNEAVSTEFSDLKESYSDVKRQLADCLKRTEPENAARTKSEPKAGLSNDTLAGVLRRFLKSVNSKFCHNHNADGMYRLRFHLTTSQCDYIKDHSQASGSSVSISEIYEVLDNMLDESEWVAGLRVPSAFSVVSDTVKEYLHIIIAIAVVTASLVATVSYLSSINISVMRFIYTLFLIIFVVSIPWTWWNLYKKEIARNMAELEKTKNPTESCSRDIGIMSVILSYVRLSSDSCTKYYEALEVHPFSAVTPTMALSVTLVRFFVEPAEFLGAAIKKLFVSSLEGVPFFLQAVICAFIIFSFIFLVLVSCNYQVRSLLFSIEPARRHNDGKIATLESENKHLKLLLEANNQQSSVGGEKKKDGSGDAPISSPEGPTTPPSIESSPDGSNDIVTSD